MYFIQHLLLYVGLLVCGPVGMLVCDYMVKLQEALVGRSGQHS